MKKGFEVAFVILLQHGAHRLLEVLENKVSISGEFPVNDNEDARYLLRETPSGKFSRTLRLPLILDDKAAVAEVKDGVLSLRIPQAEETKAKQIKVKAK